MRGKLNIFAILVIAMLLLFLPTPINYLVSVSACAAWFMLHVSMSMNVTRELVGNILYSPTFYPVVVTADAAKDVGVDIINYDSAAFLVQAGAIVAAGLVLPVAQECDTLAGVYTDVAAADLDGAFVNATANGVQKVGYKGTKRFLAIRMDYVSGTSVALAGSIVAGDPHVREVA